MSELDDLKKDAERYRFLRRNPDYQIEWTGELTLDEHVDKGMKDELECPEYVECIVREPGKSWCGGESRPFFINVEHALKAVEQGRRLVPCPECLKAAQA